MSIDLTKIREVYRAHIRRVAVAEETAERYARAAYSRLQTAQREHASAQKAHAEIAEERRRAVEQFRREFPDAQIAAD